MKYQLIENYFRTELFQIAVQDYFDTVLGKIIAENTTLPAKGLFVVNSEVKRDYYDMPYHIHILNGLIPALFIYEKFLLEKGWIESKPTDLYLRIFILGFTFHDANKLLQTQQTKDRSDLEVAVADLDKYIYKWGVNEFLPEFETHKGTVYFLALSTEDGTAIATGDYKITVKNWKHVNEVQRELCHLADGLASIQNEHLESIEALYKAIQKSLNKISQIAEMPISYLKVRANPYTLLSQNLLQVAKKTLRKSGKRVLYATREGFIYWGKDVSGEEFSAIKDAFLVGSEGDIKYPELTKITAQKCKFGFIGSAPFTKKVLTDITIELGNQFLALSPNSSNTISDFEGFVELTKQLLTIYDIPIECEVKDDKLTLRYYEDIEEEEEEAFRTIYNLHKIQWLNTRENSRWKSDLEKWIKRDTDLPEIIEFENGSKEIRLKTVPELLQFTEDRVKSTSALYKTYLNFIKTFQTIAEIEDLEAYITELQNDIITTFSSTQGPRNIKQLLFDRYFECNGNTNLKFLESYNPTIPIKKKMCAFTGGMGTVDYKAEVAFAMKARGFSNRTITSLNNNTSHLSELFAEENKLRASQFKTTKANLVVYHDFFETNLDIDREIIHACVAAKQELRLMKDGTVQFDKNAKFQYNLYNLEFISLAPKVEPTFFLVRKHLLLVQKLGLRSYIAGIMTPYQPHKSVFHFENAPRFLKLLGWDSVRLVQLEEVLDEIRLILTFGKNRLESNLLKIAQSRLAYFSLYYALSEADKSKAYNTLVNYYKKYKHKFSGMTITEKLVELAVKIDIGFKSSAEETWLIRTALDYLRRYHKQGYGREDIIQKTCGEIFRKMRMKNPSMDAIRGFSTAVYDDLFLKDWKGKVLTVNAEKDWVYQFAFLFREKSLEIVQTRKAKNIMTELESKGKALTEENVQAQLPKESRKYASQYLQIIQNLK
jgi:hypothetical protein